jgi:hypothetical protein
MTILAAGQGLRGLANRGMRSVAEIEAQENATAEQIEAAREAQKMQMYSTGAGIGASYGVKGAMEAAKTTKDAVNSANTLIEGGTIGSSGGGLTFKPTGGELLKGVEAKAGIDSAAISADVGATVKQGVEAAKLAKETGEVVKGVEAVTTATEGVGAASAAAGSSGTMATLSTIAAPVAIGLGVAFLLNKLFG